MPTITAGLSQSNSKTLRKLLTQIAAYPSIIVDITK